MDMSKSYRKAVKELLPDVAIVFDRFHVMQLVNQALDKVRRRQQYKLDNKGCKTLKGNRFLLMANYDDLDEKQKCRLEQALDANEPIMIMHTMKEQLRLLWSKPTRKKAQKFLGTWIMDAIEICHDYEQATGSKVLKPLYRLTKTLMNHMKGILGYFDHKITNGKIEGINNKIKTLKRQAYGFRDKEYFKLRLLHLHEQKARLVG